jgi:hypothetical protein
MAVLPREFGPPAPAMLALVFVVPAFRAVMGVWLFKRKVKTSWGDTFGAALASVALTYAIAEGVMTGLLGKHAAFIVTAKKKTGAATSFPAIKREIWLGTLLIAAACSALTIYPEQSIEVEAWTSVLVILSLPYVAGLMMVGLTELRWHPFVLPRMARIKLRRLKRNLI